MPRRQRATIEFTAIHLAALAACILASTAVVFLFGIYVGRGLPAHHAGIDDQVARIPVSEPPGVVAVARGPMVQPQPEPPAPAEKPVADVLGATEPPDSGPIEQAIAENAQQDTAALPVLPTVPYTVQVLATRNKNEAETLAAGLKKRRIGAFVSEVEDTGGNWYRVRIGIYDDLESAQVMETRLRNLGLQQAYVSRYR
jgi:cell division protein FtsN